MVQQRMWAALVTFERHGFDQEILPDWAQGASGWMIAFAPNEKAASHVLVRDIQLCGLRVLEVEDQREIFGGDEIEEFDEHLAANFRDCEPGKQTVWGTIHCYAGDGTA